MDDSRTPSATVAAHQHGADHIHALPPSSLVLAGAAMRLALAVALSAAVWLAVLLAMR